MNAEILKNLANWLMLEKCKEVGLNPSGTHVNYPPFQERGERTYCLWKDGSPDRPFMQVTFTKGNAPRFTY